MLVSNFFTSCGGGFSWKIDITDSWCGQDHFSSKNCHSSKETGSELHDAVFDLGCFVDDRCVSNELTVMIVEWSLLKNCDERELRMAKVRVKRGEGSRD